MTPAEISAWCLKFIEEQIRDSVAGRMLERMYVICPYCSGRNHQGAELYCCYRFAVVANAVLDRLESEDDGSRPVVG